ncbi:alpha/beta-hydrolase [Penicillium angulare]|uniref:Alpha/beta-hydrolase n=1 Tax=Penicillium angulare TaxID=116970 RepID=A0A9W9FHW2_9EURO|nr:alpha/beta-hydrolase [Penicillium angulare]
MKLYSLLIALLPAVAHVDARASPENVSPHFSILVNNTLDESVESAPSYLLLLNKQTYKDALDACFSLQEHLVQQNGTDGLGALLSQSTTIDTRASKFWISGSDGTCYAFNRRNASIASAPCEKHFQGICTNSAPFQKSAVSSISTNKSVTINTDQGRVQGFRDRLAARFQGIPYAQPPVGGLRLQNPESLRDLPTNNKDEAYSAVNFKPICPQDLSNNPGVQLNWITSEDCLYLNVYTPVIPNGKTGSLPVLVWIHGGSYYYGGSSFPYYYGMNIASRQSMVVVSINYRLGALGWLTDPSMKNSTGTNQAMRDQIIALQWVKDHISAYGGDPNQVTILGHSAGGSSVMSHIQSPASKGLFKHAWVESGNTLSGWQRPAMMKTLSRMFLDISGCLDYDCVKHNLTATQMVKYQDLLFTRAQNVFPRGLVAWIEPFRPFIDGDLLKEDWNTALSAGRFNQVPTVVSYNHDDYGLFLQENSTFEYTPANFSNSDAYLHTFLLGENRTKEVIETPVLGFNTTLENFTDIDNQFIEFTTNYWYRCNSEIYAAGIQSHVNDTWELTWEMNVPDFIPGRICGPGTNHVCHGSEIPLVFGSAVFDNLTVSALDRQGYWKKARDTIDLYARFAKHGKLLEENSAIYPRRGDNATHNVVHWNSTAAARPGGVNWDACVKMEEMRLYDRLYYPYRG